MKHFINLTSRVINKLHIIEIIKQPTKYRIYMSNNSINGFCFFASGNIETHRNIIEICQQKDKQDYDTITEIIQKIK